MELKITQPNAEDYIVIKSFADDIVVSIHIWKNGDISFYDSKNREVVLTKNGWEIINV